MDTFVEQLVSIKKTTKTYFSYALITITALLIMAVSLYLLGNLAIIIVFLIGYGAFKLYSMLNIEYEYIITNSTLDIDKIIAKSSRKRIISIDLSSVQRIEKFTGVFTSEIEKNCIFTCNKNDKNAFVLYYKQETKPQNAFVFSPNEKMLSAMKKYLPHHISENL